MAALPGPVGRRAVAIATLVATLLAASPHAGATVIPERCPAFASFPSIQCRSEDLARTLDVLADDAASERIAALADAADVALADAQYDCRQHRHAAVELARAELRDAARSYEDIRLGLAALLPANSRRYLVSIVRRLRDDVVKVRREITCPHDYENTCGDGVPQFGWGGLPGAEECDDGNRIDGDGCSAFCKIEPEHVDLSSFTTFAFSREPSFAFCPPVGALFDFTLAVGGGGAMARWSVLRDADGCDVFTSTCPHITEFARELSADELAGVRNAFRSVDVVEQLANGCGSVAYDPCLVNAFRWGDFSASDELCTVPLISGTTFDRILDVLTALTQ